MLNLGTRHLILTVLAIALAACVQSKDQYNLVPTKTPNNNGFGPPPSPSRHVPKPYIDEPISGNSSAADRLAEKVFECGSDCPASLGLMIATNKAGDIEALECTVFLFEKTDQILTESHCLPEGSREPTTAIIDVAVRFPKIAKTVRVAKVIKASTPIDMFSSDYALLQLSEKIKGVEPLKLGTTGFPDRGVFSVWRWKRDRERRVFSRGECTVTQNFPTFPLFKEANQSLASVHCNFEVTSGDSGAPVLNPSNGVTGLIDMVVDVAEMPIADAMNPEDVMKLPPMTIVTNLGCIAPIRTAATALAPACAFNFTEDVWYEETRRLAREAIAPAGDSFAPLIQAKIDGWKIQNGRVFRWKFEPDASFKPEQEIFLTAPRRAQLECVEPPSNWLADFFVHGKYLSKAEVTGTTYRWGTGVDVKNGKFEATAVAVPLGTFTAAFDPNEIKNTGAGTVTMHSVSKFYGRELRQVRTIKLKVCE